MLALNHRVFEGLQLTDAEWSAWRKWATSSSSSAGKRRKRKKRRKRRLPRTSSCSLRGRACRRQRQWYACNAGFPGDVTPRAVSPSVVIRPEMLSILAGMYQKDSGALIVDPGSGMCKACFAGFYASLCVPFGCRQARGRVGLDQKNNNVLGWFYWC